jgi:hypothetical protein
MGISLALGMTEDLYDTEPPDGLASRSYLGLERLSGYLLS